MGQKKKELSENLYNHEASARVILKLQTQLRAAHIENEMLKQQMLTMGPKADIDMDDGGELGVTPTLTTLFKTTSEELLKMRKGFAKREFPDLMTREDIQRFEAVGSNPVHATTSPGIKCVDMLNNKIVTGGNDGAVVLFNRAKGKVVAKMTGHSKPVNNVEINKNGVIVSASVDTTARVWSSNDETNYSCASIARCHTKEVTGLSMHPAQEHFLTASLDRSFALHDLNVGKMVYHCQSGDGNEMGQFTTFKMHPDGMIACGGTKEGSAHVWDLLTRATLPLEIPKASGPITSLNFSENGYYMICANQNQSGDGGIVKLWDLRKVSCLQEIQLPEIPVCARFDNTGKYVGVCTGNTVNVYNFISRQAVGEIVQLHGHEKAVQAMVFSDNVENIVSVSLDRMMKIWAVPE